MADLLQALRRPKALIGMVHVGALPGTPKYDTSPDLLAVQAAEEASILQEAGFDAVMIENMHDAPYLHGRHGPEIVATMTRVLLQVQHAIDLPVGVQVLSGGEREALAVALAGEGSFIRCENFVYSHVADEGLLCEASAGALLRYRRQVGAEPIAICCDIKKKHASHALTADLSIDEIAHTAEFFGADALIVTGSFTGKPVDEGELNAVRQATALPVLVGSGVTAETASGLLDIADALIVGSWIKQGGDWRGPVDPKRAREMVRRARSG